MMPRMTFYKMLDVQGNVHVQNVVMGMFGQHHVHTPEDFEAWRRDGDEVKDSGLCDCGMKPGESCSGWPEKGD